MVRVRVTNSKGRGTSTGLFIFLTLLTLAIVAGVHVFLGYALLTIVSWFNGPDLSMWQGVGIVVFLSAMFGGSRR